jgi:hypothetical protein
MTGSLGSYEFWESLNQDRNSKNEKITCQQYFLDLGRLKRQKVAFLCPVFETVSGFGAIKWGRVLDRGVELGEFNSNSKSERHKL